MFLFLWVGLTQRCTIGLFSAATARLLALAYTIMLVLRLVSQTPSHQIARPFANRHVVCFHRTPLYYLQFCNIGTKLNGGAGHLAVFELGQW